MNGTSWMACLHRALNLSHSPSYIKKSGVAR